MIEQTHAAMDHTVSQAAVTTMYSGAAGAVVIWGLRLSDLGVIISTVIALAGFAVQIYVFIARERRERELHRNRMETMRNDTDPGSAPSEKARLD